MRERDKHQGLYCEECGHYLGSAADAAEECSMCGSDKLAFIPSGSTEPEEP